MTTGTPQATVRSTDGELSRRNTSEPWALDRSTDHPSTAAVAGHPLHPAVVSIPIGLLSAAAASDVGFLVTRERFFARMSRWLIGGGLGGGVMAGLLGLVDFRRSAQRADRPGLPMRSGTASFWRVVRSALSCV
ncbi:MAG: DUF2231 domain-containing protein [Candidatus Limnocylindria bacterium]